MESIATHLNERIIANKEYYDSAVELYIYAVKQVLTEKNKSTKKAWRDSAKSWKNQIGVLDTFFAQEGEW